LKKFREAALPEIPQLDVRRIMKKTSRSGFEPVKFDVEHALNVYALSYATLPAGYIYDKKAINEFSDIIGKSHIYFIGFVPKIKFVDVRRDKGVLFIQIEVKSQIFEIGFQIPDNHELIKDEESYSIRDEKGVEYHTSELSLMLGLSKQTDIYTFDVKYIGQSYGKDGSRNSIDRLLKHETLQKIALEGVPEGYDLQLILFEVFTENRVCMAFSPNAEFEDIDGQRIKNGTDKLFGTTEAERVSLFEAAFIRYFAPPYNKEFKNSFPSTNMRLLRDCYEKDFLAIIAEICIDNFPFYLCSESIPPSYYHIASHDLQKDSDRTSFFSTKF